MLLPVDRNFPWPGPRPVPAVNLCPEIGTCPGGAGAGIKGAGAKKGAEGAGVEYAGAGCPLAVAKTAAREFSECPPGGAGGGARFAADGAPYWLISGGGPAAGIGGRVLVVGGASWAAILALAAIFAFLAFSASCQAPISKVRVLTFGRAEYICPTACSGTENIGLEAGAGGPNLLMSGGGPELRIGMMVDDGTFWAAAKSAW